MRLHHLFAGLIALIPVAALAASTGNVLTLIYPIPAPDISIDFAGDYSPQGNISSLLTTTRASTKWCDDTSGKWHQVGNNVLCRTNKGALIELTAANFIRNSQYTGAATGTPGTNPTNWVVTLGSGMSQTINSIAIDPATNIKYYSVTISGTLGGSGTQTIFKAQFDSNIQISSNYGKTWVNSVFIAQTSLTGVGTIKLGLSGYLNTGPTLEEDYQGSDIHGAITGSLQRFSISQTMLNENTNRTISYLQVTGTGGATVSMTLLLGQVQQELASSIESVVSATVNAPGSGYTPSQSGTMTYSGAGCSTPPVLSVTSDNTGVINAVTGVPTQGVCTPSPPAAGVTTWTPSAGLGAGSGASFHLVPLDQSGFWAPTSIIPTTSGNVTRAADVVSMALTVGSAASLECEAVFINPLNNSSSTFCGSISDGTTSNEIGLFRQGSNLGQPITTIPSSLVTFITAGGVQATNTYSAATFGSGVDVKGAASCPPTINAATNGIANVLAGTACTFPTGMNKLNIGTHGNGTQGTQGYIKTIRAWGATALNAGAVLRASQQ